MQKVTIIHHSDCLKHLTGIGHPECPARYSVIIESLKRHRLLSDENSITPLPAPIDALLLCHSQEYLDTLAKDIAIASEIGALNGEYTLSTGDVQICPDSYGAALLAAGAVIKAVDTVMQGESACAFVPVRPPGHHATPDKGMGFCIFNNVAIGARYAIKKYGLKRILIVDWDVHHGNGTQDIFFNDPRVFYFSTHQQGIYPGTGSVEDKGCGNILNCPIPGGKGARLAVLAAFRQQLTKAMESFRPELIFISAGFDAHIADPLGGFDLVTEDFAELTCIMQTMAKQYASGRLISVLEGGYHLGALAESVVEHVKCLGK
jgi:acetoin utilization deacetylase AcuC-like enzyme